MYYVYTPLLRCIVTEVLNYATMAVINNFCPRIKGMQANCLQYIKLIAAKMDSETCRNLCIADDFMVIAKIVGNF